MKKLNISDLYQAEDKDIDFGVTIDGAPILDVIGALFVVTTLQGNELFRYTLNDGISFADSTFTVQLKDPETTSMIGKYNYELWFRDSELDDIPLYKGTLKFNSTFGRFQ